MPRRGAGNDHRLEEGHAAYKHMNQREKLVRVRVEPGKQLTGMEYGRMVLALEDVVELVDGEEAVTPVVGGAGVGRRCGAGGR